MRPADSYQSPSMTPPDGYDIAEDGDGNSLHCTVKQCGRLAIEQDIYDQDMCPDHMKDEADWDRAERVIDMAQEDGYEYPQGFDGR